MWVDSLPLQEIHENEPLQRLQEIMKLLQTSRAYWKTQKRKREYYQATADVTAEIVDQTRWLKRMREECREPVRDAVDDSTNGHLSAMQAELQQRIVCMNDGSSGD